MTKAKNARAVAFSRLPRFGNCSMRFSLNAMQCFLTGQIEHCGFLGVQIKRAEFHQRLVEMGNRIILGPRSRPRPRIRCGVRNTGCAKNQFFRQLPEPRVRLFLLRIFRDAKNSGKDADDIAIQNRRRLIEGDAANRAGGVTSDSGQCENIVKRFGKFVGDDVRSL